MKRLIFGLVLALCMAAGVAGEPVVNPISPTQELELQLIRAAGQWNSFNGGTIEAALRKNKSLWRAAMLSRTNLPLIQLRDLQHGAVNADILYVFVEPGGASALEKLASKWDADELTWMNVEQASEAMGEAFPKNNPWSSDPSRVILQLWWD